MVWASTRRLVVWSLSTLWPIGAETGRGWPLVRLRCWPVLFCCLCVNSYISGSVSACGYVAVCENVAVCQNVAMWQYVALCKLLYIMTLRNNVEIVDSGFYILWKKVQSAWPMGTACFALKIEWQGSTSGKVTRQAGGASGWRVLGRGAIIAARVDVVLGQERMIKES